MMRFEEVFSKNDIQKIEPNVLYFGKDFIFPDDDTTLISYIAKMDRSQLRTFLEFVQKLKDTSRYYKLVFGSTKTLIEGVSFKKSLEMPLEIQSVHFVHCEFKKEFSFAQSTLVKCSFLSCYFHNKSIFDDVTLEDCVFDSFSATTLSEDTKDLFSKENTIVLPFITDNSLLKKKDVSISSNLLELDKNTSSMSFLTLPLHIEHLASTKRLIDHIAYALGYPTVFDTAIDQFQLVSMIEQIKTGGEISIRKFFPYIEDPIIKNYLKNAVFSSLSYYELVHLFRILLNSIEAFNRYSSFLKKPFLPSPMDIFVVPSKRNDLFDYFAMGILYDRSENIWTSGFQIISRAPYPFLYDYFERNHLLSVALIKPNSVVPLPALLNSGTSLLDFCMLGFLRLSPKQETAAILLTTMYPHFARSLQPSVERSFTELFSNFEKTAILGLSQILKNVNVNHLMIPVREDHIRNYFMSKYRFSTPELPKESLEYSELEDSVIKTFPGTFQYLYVKKFTSPIGVYSISLKDLPSRV